MKYLYEFYKASSYGSEKLYQLSKMRPGSEDVKNKLRMLRKDTQRMQTYPNRSTLLLKI